MEIYSVTTVLGKYVDWSKIPDQLLASACRRGSAVHSACAAKAQNAYQLALPDEWRGYFVSFCNWFDLYVANTIFVEKRFTCLTLGFTGQIDFVLELTGGEIALIDIKTPLPLSKTWECQLSAYDHLIGEACPPNHLKIDTIMSLRLKKDGGRALAKRYDGQRVIAFNGFLSALNAHRFIYG